MATSNNSKFAKLVVDRLKNSSLKPGHLREMAAAAARIRGIGLPINDVFPVGIVVPDGVMVRGSVGADNIGLIQKILKTPGVGGVTVFPRGIIAPDEFRLHISLK